MEVCVSGAVWSSLLLELANSKGDSEGFLIGEVNTRAVTNISDTSSQHLTYERVSTIQGLIPCYNTFSFYDNVGRIDHKKLQNTVLKHNKNIIGWYKFRRNTQSIVSMREHHIHHNLINEMRFSPCREFLFIIFTASIEKEFSVHSINYTIYTSSSKNSLFDSHELKVINLGDTSHSEYKAQPDTIRTASKLFEEVTDAYREDFMDKDGCLQQPLSSHSMYISLVTKMKDILCDVRDSESTVSVMAQQVESLREKVEAIKSRELEKRRVIEENEVKTAQLIDINDTENTSERSSKKERVVEGAEGSSKKSRRHSHQSKSRQMEPMETDILIDLSDDTMDKTPRASLPLNGAVVYQNATKEARNDTAGHNDDDSDETQDYSLPNDKQDTTYQQQSVMESMSPTY
ncbi:BRISC complex subunit Abraxas 2 [Exaiptasia diaphana]|uniref:Uncharacterized protein n=1 Tax=Exaiptasia diaphana TaxID=2652724 RepID=A0A913WSE9_EXADI|nr:BRISC complex subunit Abraxas 2 [Exaiptasia diaphana]KXJ18383.1 BRISC complex subunit Abro1 [Exaiptasia diaphana]